MSEQVILKQLVVNEGRSFDMYFKPKLLNEMVGAIQAQTALTQQEQAQQRNNNSVMMGGAEEEEEPILDSLTVGKLILNHLSQALQGRKKVESKDITEAVDQFRALRGARAIQNATVQPLALNEYPPIAIDPGNIEYKDVRTAPGVTRAQSGSVPPGALGGGTTSSSSSAPGAGGQPGMADVFNKGSSAAGHVTGFHVPAASSPLRRVFAIQQRYYFAMAQTSRSPLYVVGTNQQVHSGQLPLIPLKGLEGSSSSRTIAVLGILTYEAAAANTAAPNSSSSAGGRGGGGRREGDEAPGKSGGGDFDIGASTGQWYLEDCTMRIELGIGQAQALSCGIFAAGAIVIARGVWDGGRLQVQGFSFPPPEPRSRSLSIVNNLDCFGLAPHDQQKALQMEAATSAVVITCAHMHLDKPQTLQTVQLLFSKLQGMDPTSFTFVFSGDFTSKPRCLGDPSFHEEGSKSFYAEMVNLFTELGDTIKATAPLFAQQSQFIIVPGPSDITSCGNTLPQFPLSAGVASGFKHKCPKTTLSPNPCRLRFGTCEMVVARIDSQRLWKKPRVVRPLQQTTDGTIFTRFDHVAKTIVEQHSIAPFLGIGGGGDEGIEPVWAKDHALRLFPLPHFLVVCDSSEQWQTPCGETELVNPGCFSLESTFLWLEPAARRATVNVVRD